MNHRIVAAGTGLGTVAPPKAETGADGAAGILDRVMAMAGPILRVALPVAIAVIAITVLHHLAGQISFSELHRDLAGTSRPAIALALCATAANFAALAAYEVLAAESVAPNRMPRRVPAVTGALTHAVANFLGVALLTGGAVRLRSYTAQGLGLDTIARLIATTWVAPTTGLAASVGVLLLARPQALAPDVPVSSGMGMAIGAGLLLALGALYIRIARGRTALRIGRWRIDLPSGRILLGLGLAGVLDFSTAALALYVLLPADLSPSFPHFYVVFVAAILLGMLSHAPGGIGVFEAALIAGLGAGWRSDLFAAILVWRFVSTLIPFLVAASVVGVAWSRDRRHAIKSATLLAYRVTRPIVPLAAAGVAFLAGTVLLASGTLPVETARMHLLRSILPLPVIEASHLAGSVAGVLLLVVARGLYRRLRRAWLLGIGLLALGFVASLLKGFDWEEATTLAAAAGLLLAYRSAFYRTRGGDALRQTWRSAVPIVALVGVIACIGLFAYADVPYRDAMWWRFAWNGDAPRFLRSLLAVAVVLAAVLADAVIAGRGSRLPPQPIPAVVRGLVAASPNCEAAMALIGDKRFLLDSEERAFLCYADTGRMLITKGDPIGDPEAGHELIWQLREMADRLGRRVAFYAVSAEYLAVYLDLGLSVVKFGEIARVDLRGFSLEGSHRKALRHAVSRAHRDGLSFEVVPAARLDAYLTELRAVSDAWLRMKHGTEKGFALGAFVPAYLQNFDHAILRDESGAIIAFANLLQSGGRHELSVDLMRHLPDAPRGTMDALFAEIMFWGRDRGFQWFSLGAAPLAGLESRPLAPFWSHAGCFLYAHGERFFGFEGLRAYKEKYDPVWTPNYVACGPGLDVARAFLEVNKLISGGLLGVLS